MSLVYETEATGEIETCMAVICRLLAADADMVTLRLMRGRNKPIEVIFTRADRNRPRAFNYMMERVYAKLAGTANKGRMKIDFLPAPDSDPAHVAQIRTHLASLTS